MGVVGSSPIDRPEQVLKLFFYLYNLHRKLCKLINNMLVKYCITFEATMKYSHITKKKDLFF